MSGMYGLGLLSAVSRKYHQSNHSEIN